MGRERREENINEGERWEVKKRERGRERREEIEGRVGEMRGDEGRGGEGKGIQIKEKGSEGRRGEGRGEEVNVNARKRI